MAIQEEDFYCNYTRCNFTLILFFESILIAMYAVFTKFSATSSSTELQCVLINGLAILGFGLLLLQRQNTIKQTFIFILLAFTINLQVWPLFSKFWNQIFNGGLDGTEGKIELDITFIRLSAVMTISFLLAVWGSIRKIGIITLNLLIVLFAIGFTLNYEVVLSIYNKNSPQKQIFDDFFISRGFLFGSGFGLLFLLTRKFCRSKREEAAPQQPPQYINVFTLLGSIFIIPLFSSLQDPRISGTRSIGSMNIYFAFSSTILSSLCISAITKKIIHFEDIKVSVFSGVVLVGVVGNFIVDPFISLAAGLLGGIVTASLCICSRAYFQKKEFAEINVMLYIYFLNSFLGVFLLGPIVIAVYEALNSRYPGIDSWSPAYHMIYGGISLGIGAGFGFLCGLGERFLREKKTYDDELFLHPDDQKESNSTVAIEENPRQ